MQRRERGERGGTGIARQDSDAGRGMEWGGAKRRRRVRRSEKRKGWEESGGGANLQSLRLTMADSWL